MERIEELEKKISSEVKNGKELIAQAKIEVEFLKHLRKLKIINEKEHRQMTDFFAMRSAQKYMKNLGIL